MNTRICTIAITLAAIATLSGCVQSSPRFDNDFGASVRTSLASQVVNPSAVNNANAVAGIDGRAAAAAQQRYENSFARPTEQQPVLPGLK